MVRFVPVATWLWLVLAAAPSATAWLVPGHRRVTIEAIDRLPAVVPAFFRESASVAGEAAVDPDLWRNRGTPELGDREAPEHYLDLELLRGSQLPERRSDYLRLLGRLGVEPGRAGTLPYAVVESSERLALCFAEHRRWPSDGGIRSKCLLIAGWLSHYAADLTQPLHTTIHHDGRALPDGRSPESGLHRKVDSLLDAPMEKPAADRPGTVSLAAGGLWPAVRAELRASHALVEAVYALEPRLPARPGAKLEPSVVAFAEERRGAATRFVGEVLLWSWERSAELELPDWLKR